ncbi:MAG: hypothetical protein HYU36_16475 [Planctomycetes bacterium]|nr:hypothetical protein [Planctomycetota bacterium]
MGYNLYLVKEGSWHDEASAFSTAEWTDLQQGHEVPDWLWYSDGRVGVKNPTQEQIRIFVRLAGSRGWLVRGEEGECYREDGTQEEKDAPTAQRHGLVGRLLGAIRTAGVKRRTSRSMQGSGCPFRVGDRVRTLFRSGGVVVSVDGGANRGLGSIRVEFPDGAQVSFPFVGHDLQKE